ncbi:hypothetical protein [Calothrix sp. NIES-2098]|uniref:hypothetical protein n=1 Tax=Calothrix sp. NIES-2098 TaxID=1954171 RepID=UPI000B5E4C4B|nr:hypothetical protein NIES2098_19260 [Calothrix sp. NIES-2098]
MSLCFLILLCACLSISYFLLTNINKEVSHLVAVFAVISLILGLIFAPWQFLFLLLIVVVISTSYDYYTSKLVSQESEEQQQPVQIAEPNHSLIYRGASYRPETNAKSDGVTIQPVIHKLSFRGGNYLVRLDPKFQSAEVTTPPVTYKLNFRGSSYSVNKNLHSEIKEQGG